MKKQVVAIILVTVLVLTTFAACGKKYKLYTDKDGVKHALVTDEEGNSVRNPDGNIAVYETDKHGDIVTGEDKAPVTNGLKFPGIITTKNEFEMQDFKWAFSDEWELQDETAKKKNTSITLNISQPISTTYDQIVATRDEQLKQPVDTADGKVESEKQEISFTGMTKAVVYKHTVTTPSANAYTENYVFEIRGTVYTANFTCDLKDKDLIDFSNIFSQIKVR